MSLTPRIALLDSTGQDAPAFLTRNVEVLSGDAKEAPTRLKLFQAGKVATTKGEFQFTAQSAETVLTAARDYGNRYPFDYCHAMIGAMYASDPAKAGEAAGWFTPVVGADGALYADQIEWTEDAKAAIVAKKFRYLSPAFHYAKDGTIQEIVNCALTNLPATKRAEPIIAARNVAEESNKMEPKILAALSLAATAGADAVVSKIAELQVVAARVAELEKQIAGFRDAGRKAEVAALCRQGQDEGKLPPALLAWAGTQEPEVIKAYLAAAPKLPVDAKSPPKEETAETMVLSKEELEIAKAMGTSEADAIKAKKALQVKGFVRA